MADEALRMFVKQMNAGRWKPAMRDMADMLNAALKQIPPDADFVKRAGVFDTFSKRIERVAATSSDDSVQILGRAAISTFGALEENCTPATAEAVAREFLSSSVRALLDHRVLQPTREEVARESHRDASEQVCYERELLSKAGEEGKRLQSAVFAEQNVRPIRSPRRSVPQKETTIERLGEALPVLAMEPG